MCGDIITIMMYVPAMLSTQTSNIRTLLTHARVHWASPPTPPHPCSEAQAMSAIEARNMRFYRAPTGGDDAAPGGDEAGGATPSLNPIERLEQAEKVAEQFVATRIKPALRRAQEKVGVGRGRGG